MLTETPDVRQVKGEPRRRWFSDDYFDLIVWFDEKREIVAFQVCYDKDAKPRALTWRKGAGCTHSAIDDGENIFGGHKASPILVTDGSFNSLQIATQFKNAAMGIEKNIYGFVFQKILACGKNSR